VPRRRSPYPREFRAEAVRLARSGAQSIAQTARDLGVSYEALRGWMKQAALDAGNRTDGLNTTEREDLGRLRRENRVLEQEREILVKAAACFARESATRRAGIGSSPRRRPRTRSRCCAACCGSPVRASTPGAPARPRAGRGPTPRLRPSPAWARCSWSSSARRGWRGPHPAPPPGSVGQPARDAMVTISRRYWTSPLSTC
jgi:transposase